MVLEEMTIRKLREYKKRLELEAEAIENNVEWIEEEKDYNDLKAWTKKKIEEIDRILTAKAQKVKRILELEKMVRSNE